MDLRQKLLWSLAVSVLPALGCAAGTDGPEVGTDASVVRGCMETGCPTGMLCDVSSGLCRPFPDVVDGGTMDGAQWITDGAAEADGSTVTDGSGFPDGQPGQDATVPIDGGGCTLGLVTEVEPNNGYLDVLNNDLGVMDCAATLQGQAASPADYADGFRMHVTASRTFTFSLSHDANGADFDLGLYRVTAGLDGVFGTLDDQVTQVAYAGSPPPQTLESFSATLEPGAPYDLVVHVLSGSAGYTIEVTPQ